MRMLHAIVAALVAMLSMGTPTAHAQQTIKIGTTPSFIFLPLYAAEQLGYFKAEGITAQFVDFEGGAEVTTAMVGGSIDSGGTMVERPLILAEKGFGAKNLLALENRNPLHLVIRKDHPAKEVKDLKGARLGMTRAGSGTDLSLRALLKDAGLEPDKDVVVLAVGGVSSANAALKAGQIDGFMGGEPAGAIAVNQLKLARYFVDPRLGQGPKFLQFMTFPTLQTSDRWIAANPQLAERLVRAIVKTLKRMRNIAENPVVALVVDRYDEDWARLEYLLVRGRAVLVGEAAEFERVIELLRSRYPQYRGMRLEHGRNPLVRIEPSAVHHWKGA